MKLFSIAALATAITFSSKALYATPNWNYLQAGYTKISVDDYSEDPKGLNVSGSLLLSDNFFVRGSHTSVTDDFFSVDLNVDLTTIGAGWKKGLTDTTDIYFMGSYERIDLSASFQDEPNSDVASGFGGYVGLRSMLVDNIEIAAELGYIEISDYHISEVTLEVNANYFFTKQFSIGAGYKMFDDFNIMNITARYSF